MSYTVLWRMFGSNLDLYAPDAGSDHKVCLQSLPNVLRCQRREARVVCGVRQSHPWLRITEPISF